MAGYEPRMAPPILLLNTTHVLSFSELFGDRNAVKSLDTGAYTQAAPVLLENTIKATSENPEYMIGDTIMSSRCSLRDELVVVGNLHKSPSSEAFLSKLCSLALCSYRNLMVIGADAPPQDSRIKYVRLAAIHDEDGCRNCGRPGVIQRMMMQVRVALILAGDSRILRGRDVLFLTPAFLAILAAKMSGSWTILYSGGYPFFAERRPLVEGIATVVLKSLPSAVVDRIVLESRGPESFYKCNEYRSKCVVCPQYVDTGVFFRKKPIGSREFDIAFVGRLSRAKGIDRYLTALVRLLEEGNRPRLLIVGDGPLRKEIRSLAAEYSQVVLMNWVEAVDVPDLLNSAKFTILPSDYEGLPNTVLESLACGTPVIATRIGGITDVVVDGVNGYLMADNSPDSIRAAVLRALTSKETERLSEAAVSSIRDRYDFRAACTRFYVALRKDLKTSDISADQR